MKNAIIYAINKICNKIKNNKEKGTEKEKTDKRMKPVPTTPKWRSNACPYCVILLTIVILNCNVVFADLEEYDDIEDNSINIEKMTTEIIQTSKNTQAEPKINSRIGLIYDRASGKILYEKNGNKQTPMASTTKILTALVTVENCKLTDVVTVDSKAAGIGGSRLGLKKGDKITVNDLLYGLMLCSGNDAAIALANHVGGSVQGFSDLMNKKAEDLGLVNSHFVVPHGLDTEGHYTTAYELAKIADCALNNKKIKEIVGTKIATVTINGQPKNIKNTNELLGNLNGVYGIKTGFTNGAGRCLVTSCKRDDLDIITVVIGADTKKIRTSDSISLIEYAYKNYKVIDIKTKVEDQFNNWRNINENRITINKGTMENISLELEDLPYTKMAVKNTQIDNIDIKINSLFYLEAPIEKGTIVGNLKITIGDDVIDVLNICSSKEIYKMQIENYMFKFLEILS